MDFSSRALRRMQYVVPLLVVLTLTLLLWHHFGMERVLELSAADPHAIVAIDDRSEGGASDSRSMLVTTRDALLLNCQLRRGFEWPYCKFHFSIGKESKGLDFSDFETISFDLGYTGQEPHRIKLLLINNEPNVSTVSGWTSRRFNEIEFELPTQQRFTIPFRLLRTADWWRVLAKVPIEKADTRIDNVVGVELATVAAVVPSDLAIELHAIRFHGKWISQNSLLMLLVSAWISCGLIWMSAFSMRWLASRNERVREDERKHLKRELHDELGQYLLALRLGVSVVELQFGANNALLREKTQRLTEIVDSAIKVVRNVVTSLRPAALDLGIVSALEWLVDEYDRFGGTDMRCELHVCEEDIELDDVRATAIFRIVQESLTNIVRHARASKVDITLGRSDAKYLLEVRDNGQGFEPDIRKEKSFGLVGIRERTLALGGEVDISSVPGQGTSIRVSIPVQSAASKALSES
jgi:signal transduction histidine kinase